jgi:hypothetical protein
LAAPGESAAGNAVTSALNGAPEEEFAMGHVHSAEERNIYYLDQLCTIGFCAALGIVQILLFHYKVLDLILVPKFHQPVLWSGIVLTSLAVLRAVALWRNAGQVTVQTHSHECCGNDHEHAAHDHEHNHHHAHDHEHVHEDHEHVDEEVEDCGHTHGWAPWRYALLLLPILLFLMGMPWPAPAAVVDDTPDEPGVMVVNFQDLQDAADSPRDRKQLGGKTIRVKGMFGPLADPNKFQVHLLKMTCCFADAYPVPLKGLFLSKEPLPVEKFRGQWVYVTGKLEFTQPSPSSEYVSTVHLRTKDDIRITMPASDPYLK